MKKCIAALLVVATLAGVGAGDPYDYKKTVQRRVAPAAVMTPIAGRTLVDFEREAFGFLEFTPPKGARGEYEVRLGELLKPDGSVNMRPGATIRAARVVGTITADGVHRVPLVADRRNTSGGREGGAVPIPAEHGVVMPFRYAEVFKAPFPVTRDTVRMVAVNYPINMNESAFTCDDANLVKVYDLCKHSILATSFAGLYVDGDRERIPYEADAYLNQLSDYAVHSDYSLARASHEYLMKHPTWPTEWKQHSIKMAWADWMWTGDTRSLAKFYDALRNDKLLERFRRADGLLRTGGERGRNSLTNACGAADIVDWPHAERDGFVFRDVNAVVNAFYYRNLLEMADIARALGKAEDAASFAARAKSVHAAYQKAFFDAKNRRYVDGEGTDHASLHANAAALAFGLVPREHRRDVADFCAARGMACSVYFAQYLLEALFEGGRADRAIQLMTATGDRSWMGMLAQGATITMEAWAPKYKPNLDLNHAWGTPPINVISRYVLGVTPLEPGFAKIRIAPQVGPLRHVEGRVPTAKGPVMVRVEGNEVLTVETPAPARIEFAGQVREVPPGRHVVRLIEAARNPAGAWRPAVRWRGFNLLEMFIKGWAGAKPQEFREEDFRMIRDWGFNFVRLPMDYRYWIVDGDWERFDEAHLKYIDRAIELGRKYGVHVSVCMHRCPGYTVAQPREGTDLFTDPEAQRVCARHWAMFARRYRGIPNERLSFNLFNEPPDVPDETYGRVAKILIEAIRREDPTRFILADGLGYGRRPVESLKGIPGVGQATRGYTPMSVSHYMASWVGTPTAKPVWPLSLDAPNGVLAGRGKGDLHAPFIVSNLPPCTLKLTYGRVSGAVTVRVTADGRTVAEDSFAPQTNSPLWTAVQWFPAWKIFQGGYLGTTEVRLEKGARHLQIEVARGDWLMLGTLRVTAADGGASAELTFGGDWAKPTGFVQIFRGFDAAKPFVAQGGGEAPRYDDAGMEYLYKKLMGPWDEAMAGGMFAMAGEFGCYKYTPHALALDWLEDYLRLWKERNMGWAMWNLRGSFGILDSERTDVEYENFRGHKLDRKMLELLRKY
ncbi:MAG: cellulase family glycosylhydrolase [Kiritimatiellia bacterium]